LQWLCVCDVVPVSLMTLMGVRVMEVEGMTALELARVSTRLYKWLSLADPAKMGPTRMQNLTQVIGDIGELGLSCFGDKWQEAMIDAAEMDI
jgi:hypothetical protein